MGNRRSYSPLGRIKRQRRMKDGKGKGGKGKDSSLRQQVKIWAGQYLLVCAGQYFCWTAPGNIFAGLRRAILP